MIPDFGPFFRIFLPVGGIPGSILWKIVRRFVYLFQFRCWFLFRSVLLGINRGCEISLFDSDLSLHVPRVDCLLGNTNSFCLLCLWGINRGRTVFDYFVRDFLEISVLY